jgi:hypothetical protein
MSNYTCPSECLFANHPGKEHETWISENTPTSYYAVLTDSTGLAHGFTVMARNTEEATQKAYTDARRDGVLLPVELTGLYHNDPPKTVDPGLQADINRLGAEKKRLEAERRPSTHDLLPEDFWKHVDGLVGARLAVLREADRARGAKARVPRHLIVGRILSGYGMPITVGAMQLITARRIPALRGYLLLVVAWQLVGVVHRTAELREANRKARR